MPPVRVARNLDCVTGRPTRQVDLSEAHHYPAGSMRLLAAGACPPHSAQRRKISRIRCDRVHLWDPLRLLRSVTHRAMREVNEGATDGVVCERQTCETLSARL